VLVSYPGFVVPIYAFQVAPRCHGHTDLHAVCATFGLRLPQLPAPDVAIYGRFPTSCPRRCGSDLVLGLFPTPRCLFFPVDCAWRAPPAPTGSLPLHSSVPVPRLPAVTLPRTCGSVVVDLDFARVGYLLRTLFVGFAHHRCLRCVTTCRFAVYTHLRGCWLGFTPGHSITYQFDLPHATFLVCEQPHTPFPPVRLPLLVYLPSYGLDVVLATHGFTHPHIHTHTVRSAVYALPPHTRVYTPHIARSPHLCLVAPYGSALCLQLLPCHTLFPTVAHWIYSPVVPLRCCSFWVAWIVPCGSFTLQFVPDTATLFPPYLTPRLLPSRVVPLWFCCATDSATFIWVRGLHHMPFTTVLDYIYLHLRGSWFPGRSPLRSTLPHSSPHLVTYTVTTLCRSLPHAFMGFADNILHSGRLPFCGLFGSTRFVAPHYHTTHWFPCGSSSHIYIPRLWLHTTPVCSHMVERSGCYLAGCPGCCPLPHYAIGLLDLHLRQLRITALPCPTRLRLCCP